MAPKTSLQKRAQADNSARIVAILVFGISLLVLLGGQTALALHNPAPIATEITTVLPGTSPTPPATTTITTTAAAPDDSGWGRVLANPTSGWILDFLVAVLLAYIAGAATQRIALSYYALKLGDLEFDAVPDVAAAPTKEIADRITVDKVKKAEGFRKNDAQQPPWWTVTPPETPTLRDALIKQNIELQAGVHDIAPGAVRTETNFDFVLGALIVVGMRSSFAVQLSELKQLGDSVAAGAAFEKGADTALRQAYIRAIEQLWVLKQNGTTGS